MLQTTPGTRSERIVAERLERAHVGDLAKLMEISFGRKASAAYFDWKYFQNPLGDALGYVARASDTGEVISSVAMIPQRYRFGGVEKLVYQACDVMTHPNFRRRGLFQLVAEQTHADGLSADKEFLAIGFGGPAAVPGWLKMGWRIVFYLPDVFKPKLFCLSGFLKSRRVHSSDIVDREVERIIELRNARVDSGIVIDGDYLRWKFRNPRREYKFLYVENCLCVVHITHNIVFLDYIYGDDHHDMLALGKAMDRLCLNKPGKGILTFAQAGTRTFAAVERLGFIQNKLGIGPGSNKLPFIMYYKDSNCERFVESSMWELSAVDHDNY